MRPFLGTPSHAMARRRTPRIALSMREGGPGQGNLLRTGDPPFRWPTELEFWLHRPAFLFRRDA